MADKAFGVKQLNILGSGTPSIESPSDLNINAVKVAISTNLTVGGASTFTGNISANGNINANGNIVGDNATNISGINSVTATTYFGDGSSLTGVGGTDVLEKAGINTSGTSTFTNLNVSGVITATTFSGNLVGNVTGTASKATDVVGAANRILYNSSTDNTTTSNNLTFNGTTLGVTGALTVDNIQLNGNQLYVSSGELTIDSAGGKANINDNLYVQGVSEFNAAATFNSSVSIAGSITYDDVTNVDSVGLITARSGIIVGAGITAAGIITATSFSGDGSQLTGIITATGINTTGTSTFNQLKVTGVSTFSGNIAAGSNLFVGYSTSIPLAGGFDPSIQQVGTNLNSSTFGIYRFSADTNAPSIRFIKSRSSNPSSRGLVQFNDELGRITFIGDDGSDIANGGAIISAHVDGVASATVDMPARLSFHTAPDGTAGGQERLTIKNDGKVGINSILPTQMLDVGGTVKATSFSGNGANLTNLNASNISSGTVNAARLSDSTCNVSAGLAAGNSIGGGTVHNIFLGTCAGANINSGDYNVFAGFCAGYCGTGVQYGITIGKCAGFCNTRSNNIIIGCTAGQCSNKTTGGENIFLGNCSGFVEQGCYNTYLGSNSGALAGYGSSLQNYNTSVGALAGFRNKGCCNTYLGSCAGCSSGAGWLAYDWQELSISNVAIGAKSGFAHTEGSYNIFIGDHASNTTIGSNNIAIGHSVTLASTTGSTQLAIGCGSNKWITGDSSYNVTLAGIATAYASGIVSATKFCGASFYGDGSNLTGITAAGTGAIGGLTIKDEGVTVGTAGSVSTINFVGGSVVAIASSGAAGVATITVSGFTPDADGNLLAGTDAGKCLGGSSYSNIFLGCDAGRSACTNGVNYNIVMGHHAAQGNIGGSSLCDAACNVVMGIFSGHFLSSGLNNILIGKGSGCSTNATGLSGNSNVSIGQGAGNKLSSGCCNIFLGPSAGNCMTTGLHNIAIGAQAGRKLQNNCNVAIGVGALCGSGGGIGNCNIAIGLHAGLKLTNGHANIFMGTCAGASITGSGAGDGSYNIGFGRDALGGAADGGSTSGNFNAVMGHYSGKKISSGSSNTLMGRISGCSITSGGNNTFLGSGSGKCVSSGSKNIAIGQNVTPPSDTGNCQLVIGIESSYWMVGNSDFNVGIGTTNPNAPIGAGNTAKLSVGIVSAYQLYGDGSNLTGISGGGGFSADDDVNLFASNTCSGCNLDGSAGCFNLLLGACAGKSVTAGCYNVALGYNAMATNTVGYCNIMIGANAGACAMPNATCTGNSNIFIGTNAGKCAHVTQYSCANIFIGENAGFKGSRNCNVFIGNNAGKCNANYSNVFMGQDAGCAMTGHYNIMFGRAAGKTAGGGGCNIGVGFCALYAVTGCDNVGIGACDTLKNVTSGHHNIGLGKCAGGAINTGCCNITIGCLAGFNITSGDGNVAIGIGVSVASATGDNQFIIGNLTNHWIVGNSDYNVGIGTTNPNAPVTSGNTQKLSVGIVSAYQLYGDGSNLTGLAGFSQDDQGNLVAGTNAGAAKDADTCFNIMIGCNAGLALCGGYGHSILMGCHTGKSITTGAYNFLFGQRTGCNITTGQQNIMMGNGNGRTITSGSCNIFFGKSIAGSGTGEHSNNIVMGAEAAYRLDTGDDNIILGGQAGCDVSSGNCNVYIGKCAGTNATSGSSNIAIGQNAMCANAVTGSYNIAFGKEAGNKITSGTHQIMIGHLAGACKSCAVEGTVLIGREAGLCSDGNWNTFIGCQSGKSADGGGGNIGLGPKALEINHGNYNIAIGFGAQSSCISSSVGRIIAIGCNVSVPSLNTSCQLVIGQGSSRWIVGNSDFNVGIGTTNPNAAVTSGNTQKLSVGILSAYQLYGDGSNLTGISAGGLSHWTESANTSSPNNVVAANRLIATGAGTTIDAVIQPKSTGAFLTNLPDGAAAGGNKRGCYAVDLQMKRSGAGCVAAHNFATISGGENNYSDSTHAAIGGGYGNCAGWNAAVAGGYNNKAGGNAGAVAGGYGNCAGYMSFVGGGQYNTASGTYASVLGGSSNNASGSGSLIVANNSKTDGEKSLALGYKACTRNRDGSIAMGAHFNTDVNIGKLQSSIMHLRASTTDATQTVLTSRQAACSASTDNQLTIPTNAAYVFCGSVIANVTSGGDTHGWLFRGVMKRGSGNASLVGTPSIDDVAYDTGASGWSIALGVDTTNQALAVCVTGQSSTNITWATTVYATELQH